MAKILISTVGTLGDHVPFLALGKALQARNHQVTMAVNPALRPVLESVGLATVPCGHPYGPEQARAPITVPSAEEQYVLDLKKWEALLTDVPAKYHDLTAACADADLLIAHSYHYAALLVHNQKGLPWVCVSLEPGQYQHYDTAAVAQPAPRADLNLLASSMTFSQPDLDLHTQMAITGFWFADGAEPAAWQPTPAQKAFVEAGDRPLVMCLGSLPVPQVEQLVTLHAQAAKKLGRKLVIQKGWAEFDARTLDGLDADQVLVTDYLSHRWLLAHASAVIHSASLGITAEALRQGCPMLVEPFRRTQYFHAIRIRALGVGFAMSPAKLSVDGVARMIGTKLAAAETLQRTREVSEAIRTEDGLGQACQHIEEKLQSLKR